MGITENAAYLKGLFEGQEIDKNTKEGKIIAGMLDLILDMADKMAALEADNKELHEYCEELDSDLGELEEEFYYGETSSYNYEDGYVNLNEEDDSEDDGEGEFYELECPSCGELICFDDSLDPTTLVCPACGEKIEEIEICDGQCDQCDDNDCDGKK